MVMSKTQLKCQNLYFQNFSTYSKIVYNLGKIMYYGYDKEDKMEEKIISLIADKLGKNAKEIKLESKLVEDLGADSLDVIELVMAFEDEFKVSLPDEEISKMKTIADVVTYIKSIKK